MKTITISGNNCSTKHNTRFCVISSNLDSRSRFSRITENDILASNEEIITLMKKHYCSRNIPVYEISNETILVLEDFQMNRWMDPIVKELNSKKINVVHDFSILKNILGFNEIEEDDGYVALSTPMKRRLK